MCGWTYNSHPHISKEKKGFYMISIIITAVCTIVSFIILYILANHIFGDGEFTDVLLIGDSLDLTFEFKYYKFYDLNQNYLENLGTYLKKHFKGLNKLEIIRNYGIITINMNVTKVDDEPIEILLDEQRKALSRLCKVADTF